METTTTTGEITAAAQMLREHAARALPALRWQRDGFGVVAGDGTAIAAAPAGGDLEQSAVDLAYIAVADPAVGQAVARLLQAAAASADEPTVRAALRLARTITRQD